MADFHAGQPDHRLPGLGQDDPAAAPAGRSGAGRHRRADQRVRRGRARSPSARAHRRDDGAAAVGLPVLHHPRRAVGGDQGPPFQARARHGAGLPPTGRRELGPGRSISDPVDGAGRSRAAPSLPSRQCHHYRRCRERPRPSGEHQAGRRRRSAGADQDRPRAGLRGVDRRAAQSQSRCAAVAGRRAADRRGDAVR